MITFYILLTVFSQLSPTGMVVAALDTGPAHFRVQFEELSDVKVGTPVLVDGKRVGSVAQITEARTDFDVIVQINTAPQRQLRKGTIGLITIPMSAGRPNPECVVELFNPQKDDRPFLENGEGIRGYSSFVKFWVG